MMKKTTAFYCLCFLLISSRYIFPQDRAWDIPEPRRFRDALAPALIAGGEILLTNGVFTTINWLNGMPWAVPTAESIRFNLSTPWKWEDDDGFIVNQLGHPFQGSLYFNAGRVNGFGFYQNLLFTSFGSATWETFYENKHASINDFFTTIPGSLAAGEMSYRLYLEAHAAGLPAPLVFIISPVAGLHRLLSDWEPPPAEIMLHELRFHLGGGFAQTHSSISSDGEEVFSFNGPYGDTGFRLVYGNPFEQHTTVPFRHFELAMSFGMNPGRYHDIRLVSDGYLLSFSPVHANKETVSTGLSLHMDFMSRGKFHIHDSTIDQYSNALNWSMKIQCLFPRNTALQIKSHGGFTFFGVSQYYSPDTEWKDMKNYGYGINSKLFFSLEQRMLGKFEADFFGYALWPYPGTSALSRGTVYWLFSDISYSRFISEHFSLGIIGSFARERGLFGDFPDTRKRNDTVKLFVAWNM